MMHASLQSDEAFGSTALREVLSLPAKWLPQLPLPATLHVRMPDDTRVAWALHPGITLDGMGFEWDEVQALCVAAEMERAWAEDLTAWLEAKRADPAFHLALQQALTGAEPQPTAWSLGRVLSWYGCEALAVSCDELANANLSHAA